MTYSLAATGAPADSPSLPLSLDVSDQAVTGGQTLSAVGAGAEQGMTRWNAPVICRGPDGQEALYTYDAERSIPGVLRIMKKV